MKSVIRRELKARRDSVENKAELSLIIADKFINSDLYKDANAILLYYSVGSEVSTDKIFRQALSDGKRVAFPLCVDVGGYMEFYYTESEDDLVEGMYKIKAPKKGCKAYAETGNAVCIVPGLAFDKSGNRLGYGKGYYDRFLEGFRGISAGICFENMLVDALPCDSHDKKVNYLITDKKIYKFYE